MTSNTRTYLNHLHEADRQYTADRKAGKLCDYCISRHEANRGKQ